MAIALPENWTTFSPAEKIGYFNQTGVTPAQLLGEGVPSSDINWMLQNGYNAGGLPAGASVGFDLPQNWQTLDAGQKIEYFNEANITPTDLLNVGVPAEDISWMQTQGYTAGIPAATTLPGTVTGTVTGTIPGTGTETINIPGTRPVTTPTTTVTPPVTTATPPVTSASGFTLPAGWTGFTPAEKISWFNANNVRPSQLTAAGVPASDINYMTQNGYTAGRPFANATQGFAQNFQNYTSIPIGAQFNPNVTAFGESPYSQLQTQMQPFANPYANFQSGQAMGGYDPGLYNQDLLKNFVRQRAAELAAAGMPVTFGFDGGDGAAAAGTGASGGSGDAAGDAAAAAADAAAAASGEGTGPGTGAGYYMGGLIDRVAGPNPKGPDEGQINVQKGEYVVKKSSVNKYGKGLLDMINDGKIPAKKIKSLLD
jgi:hypothetical protein